MSHNAKFARADGPYRFDYRKVSSDTAKETSQHLAIIREF